MGHQEVWAAAVQHSRHFEGEYCASDDIHDSFESVIINISSDDGDDDPFLDSDEE